MLTPDKILTYPIGNETITIRQKIIPFGMRTKVPVYSSSGKVIYKAGDTIKQDTYIPRSEIKGIVIHNTNDLERVDDDAEQYTRATYNWAMGGVIVHFYVDDIAIWQNLVVEDDRTEVGWHAGCGQKNHTGNKGVILNGNQNTIALEIVMNASTGIANVAAENNAAKLVAWLLTKYNLTVDDVYSHKFFSSYSKQCPYYILPHWNEFKSKISTYLKAINGDTTVQLPSIPAGSPKKEENKKIYRVQIGGFAMKAYAENYKRTAVEKGFTQAYITTATVDGKLIYRVQIGAFSDKNLAINYQNKAKDAGFPYAFII